MASKVVWSTDRTPFNLSTVLDLVFYAGDPALSFRASASEDGVLFRDPDFFKAFKTGATRFVAWSDIERFRVQEIGTTYLEVRLGNGDRLEVGRRERASADTWRQRVASLTRFAAEAG